MYRENGTSDERKQKQVLGAFSFFFLILQQAYLHKVAIFILVFKVLSQSFHCDAHVGTE